MKYCPFCNAVLADEANFCLYCMSSLDEKKKTIGLKKRKNRFLPIVLTLITVILISGLLFLLLPKLGNDNNDEVRTPKQTVSDNQGSVYPKVTYTYRAAVIGDDYSSAYIPDEKDIIITGVKESELSGIYYIPDRIDGRRVLGIDPLAFSEESKCESVIKVIISDGIRNIGENAFAGCVNMTDIYFIGESIHTEINAFSQKRNGTLSIHCSETCDDRNFRLYKNNAEVYGAVYKYWDGGDIAQ